MLFCLGLSGRITQISNILCASASLREKSTDEFRVNVANVEVLPISNSNDQLVIGNILTLATLPP